MRRESNAESMSYSSPRASNHQLANLLRAILCAMLLVSSYALPRFQTSAQQATERDVSKESARPSRAWVRDGVVYEIFPRVFSSEGNFNGVTAHLDELKRLGVTI